MQFTVPVAEGDPIEFECADTFVSRWICEEILAGKTYPYLPFVDDVQVIFDVGANCGATSVHLARHYPDARIHAFEPGSEAWSHLERNAARFPNVEIHRLGLHSADGEATLYLHEGDSITASLTRAEENLAGRETVELRAAGPWAADHGIDRIDILKVDVEGAETEVIESLAHLLPTVKVLYLEYDSREALEKLSALVELTHELYSGVMFLDQGECIYLRKDLADDPAANAHLLDTLARGFAAAASAGNGSASDLRLAFGNVAPPEGFDAACAVCGQLQRFEADHRYTRESYCCTNCKAALRYQGQARCILAHLRDLGAASLSELVRDPRFSEARIWEPGDIGPFRYFLAHLDGYVQTRYVPGALPGEVRDGVRCEDLMATTFADESFDLVVTSDVFEHVRHPELGFAEIFRVLRPGGAHVFSIPVMVPVPATTVARVDVSGPDDVFLLQPMYHVVHLVYNDFGADLLDLLDEIGFESEIVPFESTSADASRLVTFVSVKPAAP
jgi:FkbM family methyltransferase